MGYMSKWNSIVERVRKNYTAKDELVQQSWKMLFKFLFGYAASEIDAQRGKTDIILQKDGEDLFMVELKRYALHDGRKQLFSYLNKLKMNLGVIVCDKLYLYDYDFTQKENAYKKVEIPFEENDEDGAKFVELFSKGNFDKQKICDFIKNKSNSKNVIAKIKNGATSELIKDLLKAHFKAGYSVCAADFEKSMASLSISVNYWFNCKMPKKMQASLAFDNAKKRTESCNLQVPEVIYKVSGVLASAKAFYARFLETKSAQRTWIYSNGNVDRDIWNTFNFSQASSLNYNDICDYRRESGLTKIILEIE